MAIERNFNKHIENRGAGDGDRTRMASLEGWSSTIELHPRVCIQTWSSLGQPP